MVRMNLRRTIMGVGASDASAGREDLPMGDHNRDLVARFYAAFAARDGAGMVACYGPGVRFSDPVFERLDGPRAGAMWRMLTAQAHDLMIELVEHDADAVRGSAHWIATYTFSRTGRRVVNDVHATFGFVDGRIVEHADTFGFYRWARQALGPTGLLLGWTPMLRASVRRQARSKSRRLHCRTTLNGRRPRPTRRAACRSFG